MLKRFSVAGLSLFVVVFITSVAIAAQDGGYNATSELWIKAVLQVPGNPVTLIWKEVGSDTTPSGDQVISGYFYADSDGFAYGSVYNPELFVKIYIASNGWCNMAFNHVTVDDVSIYSMSNGESQSSTATLNSRLVQHQYNGVAIDDTLRTAGETAATSHSEGYTLNSGLWAKAVLQPSAGAVNLIWKEVGTDITPSGDRVVSGYFYADPNDFAYGSMYNPEVFVKVYIASNGWANMAFNHVTVDSVDISSAHNYVGTSDQSGVATLDGRLLEHQYDGVIILNGNENDDDGDGYTENQGDCDDFNSKIFPGADEIVDDSIDQDCTGYDLKTWYYDFDNDLYGDPKNSIQAEVQPSGYVLDNTDYDDNDANVQYGPGDVNEFVFILDDIGELTENMNEVIDGGMSVKGTYSPDTGNKSFNAFLYSDYRKLALSPLTSYRVMFDYKILETPDQGFETIFYSPTGGSENVWLPGEFFSGVAGDSGRIVLTNTLENYDDYQIRWNIIGNGSIVIDNIIIVNLDTGKTIVNERIDTRYYTTTATIIEPENLSVYVFGETISFHGSGANSEDGALNGSSLVWTSDKDGQIGTGDSCNTSSLSTGDHKITLTATGSKGITDSASKMIRISANSVEAYPYADSSKESELYLVEVFIDGQWHNAHAYQYSRKSIQYP